MGKSLGSMVVGALLVGTSLLACSDDDERGTSDGSGGTAGSGGTTGGSAGDGGTSSGGTSSGGTSGAGTGGSATGGASGGSSVDCNGTPCAPGVLGAACCAGANGDACGVDVSAFVDAGVSCLELNAPGNPDPSCSLTIDAGDFDAGGFDAGIVDGGFQLEGCCRPDGTCGFLLDFLPGIDLGCVDPSQFGGGVSTGSCTPS